MPFDAGSERDWEEPSYASDEEDVPLSEVALVLFVLVFFLSLVYFGG